MKKRPRDVEMVGRLMEADPSAIQDVMSRYQTKIYNTALGIVKNPNDAQEIVQDVLFTIYRKIASFKGNSSFYTWIYRITVNFAFMKMRSRRKEKHVSIEEVRYSEGEEASMSVILPDKRKLAEDRIMDREFMMRLMESIHELPDKYRRIFELRDLQQLSNEEVGQILNLSIAAVKSRIHRARAFMREKMRDFACLLN